MATFIQFILHHWLLWLLLVVIIGLLIIEEYRGRGNTMFKISPQESISLINKEDAVVIDIRSKDTFASGHIANAKNLPKEDVADFPAKLSSYEKTKPILVVCYAGVSSMAVAQTLKKAGFEKVFSLAGGMNEWKNAGLPLTK